MTGYFMEEDELANLNWRNEADPSQKEVNQC